MGITGELWDEPRYPESMSDDQPRPDAPLDQSAYTLTIDEAADRYAAAGFPRPIRRLQKYCARGDLECRKAETPNGERYLITPESVVRHIAYIAETANAAGRVPARPAAPERVEEASHAIEPRPTASEPAQPRSGAPEEFVGQLEKRLTEKDGEIAFLRSEVTMKNEQIKDLTERARETNHLIAGLQKMLTPLLGNGSGHDAGA